MSRSGQITNLVRQSARAAGFDLVGVAPVDDFGELDRFREWVAAGRAAEMTYMEARDEAGNLKRASLRSTLPWVRSVIVCAINYNTAQPYSTQLHPAHSHSAPSHSAQTDDPQPGWIARY